MNVAKEIGINNIYIEECSIQVCELAKSLINQFSV